MLQQSRNIDVKQNTPESIDPNQTIVIRYYRMTKDEYTDRSTHTVTMLFHPFKITANNEVKSVNTQKKKLHSMLPIEGVCCDIKTLIQEKYLRLNGKDMSIPIPLSQERWNWLLQHAGFFANNISYYSRSPYVLNFPLLHGEMLSLMRCFSNCIIISMVNGWSTYEWREISDDKNIVVLGNYDASPQNRFLPPFVATTQTTNNVKKITRTLTMAMLDDLIARALIELQDVDVVDNRIVKYITSNEYKKRVVEMVMYSNMDDVCVISNIIQDALVHLLDGAKTNYAV